MEDFRKAMYSACRQMQMEIVPIDIGARVMAYVGLAYNVNSIYNKII